MPHPACRHNLARVLGTLAVLWMAQAAWADDPADEQSLAQAPAAPRAAPAPAVEKPAAKQPPAPVTPPPAAARQQPPLNTLAAADASFERLAGTPNMFGDLFGTSTRMTFTTIAVGTNGAVDLPLAAGSRRLKIGEDDSPLLQDRVFFLYNRFQNAVASSLNIAPDTSIQRTGAVDRFTFGFEKTLCDSCWSVEMRMPLASEPGLSTPLAEASGGYAGNLAVIVKRLLYESDTTVVSAGLGIDTPTGSSAQTRLFATDFTVHNDALHLLPYVGVLRQPCERFFYLAFLQLDVAANGNRIDSSALGVAGGSVGSLTDQTLLYADVSAGWWLLRDPCRRGLTGLAALVELHSTTALQPADTVVGTTALQTATVTFGNTTQGREILDLTVGLHAEFTENTLVRVGAAFPLGTGGNRWFDSEILVQLERRF